MTAILVYVRVVIASNGFILYNIIMATCPPSLSIPLCVCTLTRACACAQVCYMLHVISYV